MPSGPKPTNVLRSERSPEAASLHAGQKIVWITCIFLRQLKNALMFAGDLSIYLLLPFIQTILPLTRAHAYFQAIFHRIEIDELTPIARITVGCLCTNQVKKRGRLSPSYWQSPFFPWEKKNKNYDCASPALFQQNIPGHCLWIILSAVGRVNWWKRRLKNIVLLLCMICASWRDLQSSGPSQSSRMSSAPSLGQQKHALVQEEEDNTE